ncbi:MAG: RHS repeat domain-containing protein [Bacteroidales bacterium]
MKQSILNLVLCGSFLAITTVAFPVMRSDVQKNSLTGKVHTCTTRSYNYKKSGNQVVRMEAAPLDYGGDGYYVDSYFEYDPQGLVLEEEYLSDDLQEIRRKRIVRNADSQITEVRHFDTRNNLLSYEVAAFRDNKQLQAYSVYDSQGKLIGRKIPQYDSLGRQTAIYHYDAAGNRKEITDSCAYDKKGNRIFRYKEGPVNYTMVLDPDDKLVEEQGVFEDGKEYFHNFHQYDRSGKRIRTIFTVDGKVNEEREDPYSQNILDDGTVLKCDSAGNWTVKIFPYDDETGSMVERTITYYK